jgi:hypothetical protein
VAVVVTDVLDRRWTMSGPPSSSCRAHITPAGANVRLAVRLGGNLKDTISVDVVVTSRPTTAPTTVLLEPAVPMRWPDGWPEVQLYPLADHTADKICALYERHVGGASSRYRDLADLLLISQQAMLIGGMVQRALASEVTRRESGGTVIVLPTTFQVPALAGPRTIRRLPASFTAWWAAAP